VLDDGETSFLERFPKYQRGPIGNHFYSVVRLGHTDPDRIIAEVLAIADRQFASLYLTEEKREVFRTLKNALLHDRNAVLSFITQVLERERMAPEVRGQMKQERSRTYQRSSMANLPPTDAQLRYPSSLGYQGNPPSNRLEASDLIETCKGGTL
jgi:hypothetical protein